MFVWGTSLVVQMVKNRPAVRETHVWCLDWEDPLEKEMATHSRFLAWKVQWTKELGRLQIHGIARVRHNWATNTYTCLWFYIINNINSVGPVCWKGLKDLTPQFVRLLLVSKCHFLIKEILGFTEKVIDSKDGIGIIQNDPEWFCIARKHGHIQKRRKEKRDEGISKEHRSLSEYHKCVVAQWCPTLCDPMDCSLPDSYVRGGSPGKNTGVSCHTLL